MYKDIDFKFKKDSTLGCTMKEGIDAISQSIGNILKTRKGERIGDPNFGCAVKDYLFEKMSYITAAEIKSEITNAINIYEPRVVVIDVAVYPNFDQNRYDVYISYELAIVKEKITLALSLSIQE